MNLIITQSTYAKNIFTQISKKSNIKDNMESTQRISKTQNQKGK